MGRKPKIQTRVERDTKEAIDAYVAENEDLSQAEAIRHLIRAGLAQKGHPVAAADGGSPLERLASPKTVLLGVALMLLATATLGGALVTSLTLPLAIVGTGIVILGLLTLWTALLAQIALAKPLKGLLGLNTEESA